MATAELGPMTSSESRRSAGLLLVPLGSTEQHGPHLPLDTDSRIAVAWAEALAPRLRGVVAPVLPYGSAGEHQAFPGTVSIGQAALGLVLVELVRSATITFERIVFVSGHAGNIGPVGRVVEQMTTEGHRVMSVFPHWPSGDARFPKLDAHAGRVETSLILHLHPELVRLDRAEPGATAPVDQLLSEMQTGGVAAVTTNGVLGDPTGASAEEGRLLLTDLVERSVELVTASFGHLYENRPTFEP